MSQEYPEHYDNEPNTCEFCDSEFDAEEHSDTVCQNCTTTLELIDCDLDFLQWLANYDDEIEEDGLIIHLYEAFSAHDNELENLRAKLQGAHEALGAEIMKNRWY